MCKENTLLLETGQQPPESHESSFPAYLLYILDFV
jgi:hypothetical protein